MPTNTDLVTDLPADFEVFGQAVDTSLADLKGGTTGQILSKATNTDMDFVWTDMNPGDITGVTASSPLTGGGTSGAVTIGILSGTTSNLGAVQLSTSTSSTSTSLAATASAVKSAYDLADAAIPKSTVTAKGSIVAATGSSTPANLAVGNNGETLVADSSTSTGLRYSSGMRVENPIINSAFDVAQRGTSFTTNTTLTQYSLDRWVIYCPNTNATVSQQATNDTTNLPTIRYCARIQRNAGATNLNNIYIMQNVETSNAIRFAGQTVTMSYWARAGANFSAASSFIETQMYWGTGVDQNVFNYTGATSATNNQAITTTWTRYSITYSFPATATEFCPRFSFLPVGTAGANDWFEITGIQLDIGSVALPYRRNGATIQGELAACQRYFQIYGDLEVFGTFYGSSQARFVQYLPVAMRTAATPTFPTGTFTNFVDEVGVGTRTPTAFASNSMKISTVSWDVTGMTGATAGRQAQYRGTNIQFSAEL